jgi:hypothetical protein
MSRKSRTSRRLSSFEFAAPLGRRGPRPIAKATLVVSDGRIDATPAEFSRGMFVLVPETASAAFGFLHIHRAIFYSTNSHGVVASFSSLKRSSCPIAVPQLFSMVIGCDAAISPSCNPTCQAMTAAMKYSQLPGDHRSGAPQRADRLSAPRRTRIDSSNPVGTALTLARRENERRLCLLRASG